MNHEDSEPLQVIKRLHLALDRIDKMEPRLHGTLTRNTQALERLLVELNEKLKTAPQIYAQVEKAIEACRNHMSNLHESLRLRELRHELRSIQMILEAHYL